MAEAVHVNLAGIQRLRALIQHFQAAIGFVKIVCFFRHGGFQRAVQFMQFTRHLAKRLRQQPQFVGQAGIQLGDIKLTVFNLLAGHHQLIEGTYHLLANPPQSKEH